MPEDDVCCLWVFVGVCIDFVFALELNHISGLRTVLPWPVSTFVLLLLRTLPFFKFGIATNERIHQCTNLIRDHLKSYFRSLRAELHFLSL